MHFCVEQFEKIIKVQNESDDEALEGRPQMFLSLHR